MELYRPIGWLRLEYSCRPDSRSDGYVMTVRHPASGRELECGFCKTEIHVEGQNSVVERWANLGAFAMHALIPFDIKAGKS